MRGCTLRCPSRVGRTSAGPWGLNAAIPGLAARNAPGCPTARVLPGAGDEAVGRGRRHQGRPDASAESRSHAVRIRCHRAGVRCTHPKGAAGPSMWWSSPSRPPCRPWCAATAARPRSSAKRVDVFPPKAADLRSSHPQQAQQQKRRVVHGAPAGSARTAAPPRRSSSRPVRWKRDVHQLGHVPRQPEVLFHRGRERGQSTRSACRAVLPDMSRASFVIAAPTP